jgi:hypothetical protein|uniref:Uncharacterized protein n=1 Tax=Picea glauca TaxID=3330 RepID=A0A124GN98_PICGL|nr:hypothetical protein ABT39_MTgene5153 [Picea glauca]QHR91197.1 hypothetical protein Q903MT_gene5229 [Picea sitchensis]
MASMNNPLLPFTQQPMEWEWSAAQPLMKPGRNRSRVRHYDNPLPLYLHPRKWSNNPISQEYSSRQVCHAMKHSLGLPTLYLQELDL